MSSDSAVKYHKKYVYSAENRPLLALIPKEATRFLDVGCGTGALAAAIQREHGWSHFEGITYSEEEVQYAQEIMHKVWFEDKSMGGSQDLYVSSVDYYYKSPANSSYKKLYSEGGYHGNLYDNSPSSTSVQGSYGTKIYVNWSSTLAYVGARFYANTMMHLEYLTPYGLYKGM